MTKKDTEILSKKNLSQDTKKKDNEASLSQSLFYKFFRFKNQPSRYAESMGSVYKIFKTS